MSRTMTEVRVQLEKPPRDIFGEDVPCPNYFRFRLGPEVAIAVGMRVMRPGMGVDPPLGEPTELLASEDPKLETLPYERLLDDAMRGDQMLFARQDEIEAQWRVVDPVLGDVTPVYTYDKGSWGPTEAERLFPPGCFQPIAITGRPSP
jgi:glucose-6-phosphate 1-dehydrogenase